MNHIYRLIWNRVSNAWVAAAESARGRGKRSSRKLVAAALSLTAGFAQAAPAGGQVASGAGSIDQSGATTTITQSSQSLSLNWKSFNIAKSETVNFVQPSASAIAVNRIFDTNGSQILGQLNANGQVYLFNPNGILFGQGAQVNVGSLVASTLDVSNASLSGNSRLFSGNGAGSIVNQGTLNAAKGGYVALLGNTVSNQGAITAPLGTVALGAGSAVTLNFNGNSLVKMQIDQSVLNSLAENGGLIRADGGLVVMNAGAKDALLASVVNNTGVIEARTVENHEGTIILLGGMAAGTVNVGGTLEASAPNGGNGGFIETSAAHVKIADDVKISTFAPAGKIGSWLIDPVDFTIAAGSAALTTSGIGASALSSSLESTNVSIATDPSTAGNGDIFVNSAVSWSANKLTLSAHRNININANLNGSGTASLALEYGLGDSNGVIGGVTATYNVNAAVNLAAGPNFSTKLGSSGSTKNYTVITSLGAAGSTTATDLQGMNGNLDANYVLGSNIDASATSGWNSGAGFAPITHALTIPDTGYFCITYGECMNQTQLTPFTGTFDGLGHSISALTINRPSTANMGLFGRTSTTAQIRNIGLVGGSVIGQGWVGALVGDDSGTISNSYATGSVTGTSSYIGGLVGAMHSSTISNSYSTGNVNGGSYTGGLLGYNDIGTINNSYATGSVIGSTSIGGLVGTNYHGSISNSHASGSVTGNSQNVGGLAGESSGTVSNSYASGPVQGSNWSGGLLGYNTGTLSNSYATGSVSGTSLVGGLVGNNQGAVGTSYATGSVNGTFYVGGLLGYNNNLVSYSYATGLVVGTDAGSNGGLVGVNDGGVTYSYWNKDLTTNGIGRGSLTGSTGLTSAEMQTASNFAGFNFTSTPGAAGNNWVMVDADGSLNNAGGATGTTRPMLASEYSTSINNAHQLQLMAMAPAASYTLGSNVNAASTGLSTDVWGSSGFAPIGSSSTPFTGTFDGLGHTISNLTINRPSTDDVGLFGVSGGGNRPLISNVGLINENVTGRDRVGGLIGQSIINHIVNSYATSGQVSGRDQVGGLIGFSNTTNADATYSSNNVRGASKVGGLWGETNGGVPTDQNYSSGNVTGTGDYVGGLVGYNGFAFSIGNSYATGDVTGSNYVGGLVGYHLNGEINKSYATGKVIGTNYVGGLVGGSDGTVTASFWDSQTSGQLLSEGGTAKITDQMLAMSSFSGWNIANNGGSGAVWRIYEGHTNPLLTSFMTNLTLTDVVATYSGSAQSGASIAQSGVTGVAASGTNAGIFKNSYYSSQQGYDITDGNLTINKAGLLLSGTRTYDGSSTMAGSVLTATGVASETFAVTGAGDTSNLASKNVQLGSTLASLTGLALGASGNGGLSTNYNALSTTGSSVSISKANLTLGTGNVSKTYDGGLTAAGTATVTGGTVFSGDTLSGGSFAFTDKNVGAANKTVTPTGVTVNDGNSGANYIVSYANNTTSTISQADLAVSGLAASDKVYDASTSAILSGSAVVTKLGSDDLTLSGTAQGTFASKNVGTQAVTVSGNTLSGADAGNYNLRQQSGLSGDISKAPLTYAATPANFLNGQPPPGLSGSVNGFAAGDTLANSTTGSLTWTTNAGTTSQPGTYAIDGNGLIASNYVLAQAAGNTTALTLKPATPPEPVRNATSQLASIALSPQTSAQSAMPSLSPSITVTQSSSSGATSAAGDAATSGSSNGAVVNVTMAIGGTGPALQIVNGGMRLPGNMVNVNE